jgi:CPA2 family monovalent cation:H+ antiporter-2
VFAVLFFVAVGSLIDPSAIPETLGWIGLVLTLTLCLKGGSIVVLARFAGLPKVSPWHLGGALAQIGEFSFVLASVGATQGWIEPRIYTAVLSGVVVSIAVVTVAVRRHPWQPMPGAREAYSRDRARR